MRELRQHSNCATGWTTEELSFDFQHGQGIFLSSICFRAALGSTQPLIQWVPSALSTGVKLPWREAGHHPRYTDVEDVRSYTSTAYAFTSFTVTALFVFCTYHWYSAYYVICTVHTASFVLCILRHLYYAYYVICTVHTTSFYCAYYVICNTYTTPFVLCILRHLHCA